VDALYDGFVESLGEDGVKAVVELAEERQRSGDIGHGRCSIAGEFIRLCKERSSDPAAARDKAMLESFLASEYEAWEPRMYQIEMARLASELGNAAVIAPTGTGKTKVISLRLERLWEQNPSAKAVVLDITNPLVYQMGQKLKQSCRSLERRFAVFCGSNHIPQRLGWKGAVSAYDCLILTPAYLIQIWR
jgi:superfamily I DNA and RNA helicase